MKPKIRINLGILASLFVALIVLVFSCKGQDFVPTRTLQLRQGGSGGVNLLNNLRFYAILDTTNYDTSTPNPWKSSDSAHYVSLSSFSFVAVDSTKHLLGSGSLECVGNPAWLDWTNSIEAPWTGIAAGNSGTASGSDFTVNFWYLLPRADVSFDCWAIMGTRQSSLSSPGWEFRLAFQPGPTYTIEFAIHAGTIASVANISIVIGTKDIADGNWHMITGGFNHSLFSEGAVWLMIDGANYVQQDCSANSSFSCGSGPYTDSFGCGHAMNGSSTVGMTIFGECDHSGISTASSWIDEVGIWIPRSFSSSEVSQLYNGGLGKRPPGM